MLLFEFLAFVAAYAQIVAWQQTHNWRKSHFKNLPLKKMGSKDDLGSRHVSQTGVVQSQFTIVHITYQMSQQTSHTPEMIVSR